MTPVLLSDGFLFDVAAYHVHLQQLDQPWLPCNLNALLFTTGQGHDMLVQTDRCNAAVQNLQPFNPGGILHHHVEHHLQQACRSLSPCIPYFGMRTFIDEAVAMVH